MITDKMKTKLDNTFLWTLYQKYGMVSTDSVQDNMNRALEKEIRERHAKSFEGVCAPQKITPPGKNSKRPLWQTYVLKDGKLTRIQRKDKETFFACLADLYLDNFKEKKTPSLKMFWEKYFSDRTASNVSPRTVSKDVDMWKKYIKDDPFWDQPVDVFSKRDVQRWFDQLLSSKQVRDKEFSTIRMILKALFELAIDQKYINENPASDAKSKRKTKKARGNTDPHRFFTEDEYFQLKDYFWDYFHDSDDSHALAVLFSMGLALRSGELAALRWEDISTINDRTMIYVHRHEVPCYVAIDSNETKRCGFEVVDHCKANSDRWLELDEELLYILDLQKELGHDNSGYIFGNGERMTSRQLSWQYEKVCRALGIETRRNHTMRRTVASLLFDHGVNPVYIQHLLGHETLAMTYEYIGRVMPEALDRAKASAVLSRHQKSPKISVA